MKKWVIYKLTNPIGQVYIGNTCNFRKRMGRYRTMKKYEGQRRLYDSIVKYGLDNHEVVIIEENVLSQNDAFCREVFWIKKFMSNYNKCNETNGLNLTDGGVGSTGSKLDDKSKMRISKLHSGKIISQEVRDKMSIARLNSPYQNLQKKHTEETKLKLSAILKGKNMGVNHHSSKRVLNTNTGIKYDSIRSAAQSIGKNTNYLHHRLSGRLKNKTPFRYI